MFFVHDYHFNYFQFGVESLGADFFDGDQVSFGPAFRRVWEPYARATLAGSAWLKSGYATEPLRTGDAVVSVASSASVLYYADTVTYPDNTSEPVEIISLPCPTFAGGEKLVMQRGAGICTVRFTPERERACMTFLKWLTAPKRNVDFVTRLGYMPVTQTAFANELPSAVRTLEARSRIVWIAGSLVFLAAMLALSAHLSRRFVTPIARSLQAIREQAPGEHPSGISEIDELLAFVRSRTAEQLTAGSLPPNIEDLLAGFRSRVQTLTPMERTVLQYYIDGCSLEEVAARAYISVATAKKHNTNINRKLGVTSREELMLYIDLFRRCGRLDEIAASRAEDTARCTT